MAVKGSMRTIKLPLSPHAEQEDKLNLILSACRCTYNDLLENCRDILIKNRSMLEGLLETGPDWETEGLRVRPEYIPLPSEFDLIDLAGEARDINLWRRDAYATCIDEVGSRVSRTVSAYFRDLKAGVKRGLPRFKSKSRYDTFTYTANNQYYFDPEWLEGRNGPRIHLGGVGWVHFSNQDDARCLPNKGIMKQATVKRRRSHNKDFWSLIIYYDTVEPKEYCEQVFDGPEKEPVGIDIGARKTAVLSDGTVIENLHLGEKDLKKRADLNRKITAAEDDPEERSKWQARLNNLVRHQTDRKMDHLHKATRKVALEHDVIVMEDLKVTEINNNTDSHRTHRMFGDASPGLFRRLLGYKAEEAGARVICVDPAYTSQTCSRCRERTDPGCSETFVCDHCGYTLDRDLNASRNILRRGMRLVIRGTQECPNH